MSIFKCTLWKCRKQVLLKKDIRMILHIGFIPDMRRLNWHRSHAFSRLNLWLPFKIATSLTIPAAIRCLWQDRTKIKTTRRLKSQCSFPKHKVEKKPQRIKVMKVWECNGVWKFMSTVIMADLKKKKFQCKWALGVTWCIGELIKSRIALVLGADAKISSVHLGQIVISCGAAALS